MAERWRNPVTFEALSGYLKALDTCEEDDIDGPRRKGAGPTFTCTKRINGVLYIVEQVRTANGELAFFDMWIKENKDKKITRVTDAPSEEGPLPNVRNARMKIMRDQCIKIKKNALKKGYIK